MGCGASKTTVVQVRSSELNGDGEDTGSKQGAGRGDSAVSKFTTDSGVVLETGEALTLPGAVPRKLPPLSAPGFTQESPAERPRSSEILEQLWSQGIIPAQHGDQPSVTGEAYNSTMDDREMPKRRPPTRLESLKTRKDQALTFKEDMEEKMRQEEERRKLEEEELRPRTRSARVHAPPSAALAEGGGSSPLAALQTPPTSRTPPHHPRDEPPGLQDPLLLTQTPTLSPGTETGGAEREGRASSRQSGEGSRASGEESRQGGEGSGKGVGGSRDGGGVREREREEDLPAASLEMESDCTFQQTEEVEEIF